MGGARVVEDDVCKCCGQKLKLVRNGVPLSPMMTKIFDAIKRNPGISTIEIVRHVYGWEDPKKNQVIYTRIYEINDRFSATDIAISSGGAFTGWTIKGE